MSNFNQLRRQLLIIRKIEEENRKGKYPCIKDLQEYLEKTSRDNDKFGFSEPSIKRDFSDIRTDFKIALEYSKKELGYYIEYEISNDSIIKKALESFEILTSINMDGGLPEFVIPESRKPTGTEHFYFLLKSIESKSYVTFRYHKFESNTSTNPIIAPYAIKESRGRWYLLGTPKGEKETKSYGLDRMEEVDVTGELFSTRMNRDTLEKKYIDCFAMFTSNEEPQKVVLSYDERDGNYIKSFPIHHSQKIQYENNRVIV
ncbi:MAG TPA: WYL domain-containing protein, partial [Flavobacterium sp.]|nr:WYL domain-containing protein [Flavobacterium sp.]